MTHRRHGFNLQYLRKFVPLHAYQAYCPTTRVRESKHTRGMKRKRRGGGGGGGKAQGRGKGATGKKMMKTAKRYACDF